MSRQELVKLPCWTTHWIQPRSTKVNENDNVYDTYARRCGQSIKFVRHWLEYFTLSNSHNPELRGFKYLSAKDLTYENWSIWCGRKGDVWVIFALSMLLDVHMIVHLKNGAIWTSVAKYDTDHYVNLNTCEIYLVYLGMGIFVELCERPNPLYTTVDDEGNIESIVLGEVTAVKRKVLDKFIQTRMDTAPAELEVKPSTSMQQEAVPYLPQAASSHKNIGTPAAPTQSPMPEIQIKLNKLQIKTK